MVKILVNKKTNLVVDVTTDEFETHTSLEWHNIEDENIANGENVTNGWRYDPETNSLYDPDAGWEHTPEGQRQIMINNRVAAYGQVGDQLDAIFRDLRDGTSLYVDHITNVKAKYPKVAAVDEHDVDKIQNQKNT